VVSISVSANIPSFINCFLSHLMNIRSDVWM
jgi:hypothetical protein